MRETKIQAGDVVRTSKGSIRFVRVEGNVAYLVDRNGIEWVESYDRLQRIEAKGDK